jgi:hypothetical protein
MAAVCHHQARTWWTDRPWPFYDIASHRRSVLLVSGRERVVPGRNGVLVADLTVPPMDDDLTATAVPDDLLRSAFSVGLRGVV